MPRFTFALPSPTEQAKQRAEAAAATAAAVSEESSERIAAAEAALASALSREESARAGLEALVSRLQSEQAGGQAAGAILARSAQTCGPEEAAVLACYSDAALKPVGASLECAEVVRLYAACAKQATM